MYKRKRGANETRLASISNKVKRLLEHQQHLKVAFKRLDSWDHGNTSVQNPNHVVFSEDDDGECEVNRKNRGFGTLHDDKIVLFDEDNPSADLHQLMVFEDAPDLSQSMMKLQMNHQGDSRFCLDSRFADSDENLSAEQLGQVEDRKLSGGIPLNTDGFKDASYFRFDPMDNKSKKLHTVQIKPEYNDKNKSDAEKEILPDQQKFYQVSIDALRDAFASKNDKQLEKDCQTFSFVAAFQGIHDKVEIKQMIPLAKFDAESIGGSEAMDHTDEVQVIVGNSVHTDSFFPTSIIDLRIKDAADNFCWKKSYQEMQDNWVKVKDILMKDYKKKKRDARKRRWVLNSSGIG